MNNDKKTTEYIEKLKDMKLSEVSRARIENNLLEYARFHGVRVEGDGRSIEQVPPRTSWFTNYNFKKLMAPIALALILMVGAGGTVAASGSARPGDTLFPIERAVEKTRVALAFDADTKAELRSRFADERIEEFRSLVAEAEASSEAETSTAATTTIGGDDGARLETAVAVLVDYAATAGLDSETRSDFMTRLNAEIDKIDLRLENGMRIRINSDEVRVDTDDDSVRVDDDTSVSSDGILDLGGIFGGDRSGDTTVRGSFEIEADAYTDVTIVTVEHDDQKETFRTDANTRAEVVAEVAARYNIDRATVDAAMTFEVEDRASRPDDVDIDADASVGAGVSGHGGDVDSNVNLNLR